jgi:Domain of unknown function (DUF4166)
VLFAEYGHGIPFEVVNTPGADGGLAARRTFAFPRRIRVMDDRMRVVDRRLLDRLGKRGGFEVELRLDVVDAALQMSSGLGHTQRVDVRMTAPLLGEVFRYTGTFSYAYLSSSDPTTEPSP